jgi:hypothetical protein
MAECVYCGNGTLMFVKGVPVCIDCADDLRQGRNPVRRESRDTLSPRVSS